MNFALYLMGLVIVVSGLAYGANRLGVSPTWIGIGAAVVVVVSAAAVVVVVVGASVVVVVDRTVVVGVVTVGATAATVVAGTTGAAFLLSPHDASRTTERASAITGCLRIDENVTLTPSPPSWSWRPDFPAGYTPVRQCRHIPPRPRRAEASPRPSFS